MEDAISLGVGEPDFVTPWHIRNAGIESLKDGHTYYTSNWGLIELREEISKFYDRKYGLKFNPKDEVFVTVGGSEAVDAAIRALVEVGDEVLIPEPSFVCYKPCVNLIGGIPVPIVTTQEDNFKLTPENLISKITPKTKLLILSYPNNPTGAIMTKEDLEKIVDVIKDKDIMVISDEIYSELTYGKKHASIAQFPEMKDKTIIINGFSKAYAMTGWRLGYALGHKDIISAMIKIHQYAIMSSPTTSQYAAIEALKNGDSDIEMMKNEYDIRRRVLVDGLNKIGLECFEPLGAFYVFPSIKSTGLTSEKFCEELLKREKLAVIPGSAFGESGEGFVRISYAYSLEKIKKALIKIESFVNSLNKE
ncbi:MAG: aminotransferase class I/II-fold pyridoxal phosphate-dependent enzyme [Clostridia bacterium]|nr:aminotransferase class I/II-fold pyridoxal phosphate-dependent enzyme [Oscillospiraceae bacterium]MBR4893365.1 aminotransferase class I/II-fold pyridoxal phosphate-dependent enzyme [Clostridia bacterium]